MKVINPVYRPLSEAPKDGTIILGVSPRNRPVTMYYSNGNGENDPFPRWILLEDFWIDFVNMDEWMWLEIPPLYVEK